MMDFSEKRQLDLEQSSNRARQLVAARYGLGVPGVARGIVQAAEDGFFRDEDGNRVQRLRAGMVFDSAKVGP